MSIIKKKPVLSSSSEKIAPGKDLSIALDIQSRNKRKKMARGGEVIPEIKNDEKNLMEATAITKPFQDPKKLYDEKQSPITSRDPSEEAMLARHAAEREHFYSGGSVGEDDDPTDQLLFDDYEGAKDDHPGSIAEAIMTRRKYADGGTVEGLYNSKVGDQRAKDSGDGSRSGTNDDFREASDKATLSPLSPEEISRQKKAIPYAHGGSVSGDLKENYEDDKEDRISKIMKRSK